jgi:glycosyltransferase involved in cell wall biosynthesis
MVSLFDQVALRASDYVQVSTEYAKSQVSKISDRPTLMIPYSIDPSFYMSTRIEDGLFTIGYFGSLDPINHDFGDLLGAVRRLRATMPSLRVVLVGGAASQRSRIASMVQSLELGDVVKLTGPVSHALLPELLSRFDVLVNPQLPKNPGLSIKVIESMAAGIPAVTTVPDKQLLHDGENCLLIAHTEGAYEEAIKMLCSDRVLMQRLSENGKLTAEQFKRSVVASKWRQAIEDIAALSAL